MTMATGLCGLIGMALISVQAPTDHQTSPAPAAHPADKSTGKSTGKPAEGIAPKKDAPSAAAPKAYSEALNGTTLTFNMVPFTPKDGSKPFYVATCETTWDLYDVFLFGFDQEQPNGSTPEADAVSRPSKPYISMDRGFGHAGFPAISISYYGAKMYCEWLSAKTGKTYRLPTVSEWKALCEQGAVSKESAKEYAWFADNADAKTHAVGTAKADANGCFDLWGNASEWCTNENGKGVTLGGTFKDGGDAIGCASLVPSSAEWNASDPQFPKSKWWLADGGFVGFRVVCEIK
ncbi:MAG: SUMF1/EgtB/PvdO family nonheme iron enzyme [Phycisphaerae bacterium]|nr:SUMF1/EgtB/PvdO family nonheme iron enzyme [Phycisphaerae bacterium]